MDIPDRNTMGSGEFTRSEYERPARHGSKINGWPVPNLLLYRIGWFNGVADSAVEGKLYKGQGMLLAGDALVCCWFDGQCAVVLQCLQLASWGASEPAGQGLHLMAILRLLRVCSALWLLEDSS